MKPYIEPHVDFVYPSEDSGFEYTADNLSAISASIVNGITEFIRSFIFYTLPTKNPRLTLAVYAYASGMDLSPFFGENSMTVIASSLGCSKQSFSKQVTQICELHRLRRPDTGKNYEKKTAFEENGRRTSKPVEK